MMQDRSLYILDIYGFLFRAYYALPSFSHNGLPVGAIYGMTNMLIKLLHSHEPSMIVAILDSGRSTFRNEIYIDYKANRDAPPEDLIPQFGLIEECLSAFGVLCDMRVGYEADDLIATYTKHAADKNLHVTVVSSDKDLMQLVCDGVDIYDPMKDKLISTSGVIEKFGISPSQVMDYLSLLGDASDNIPGVKGIGAKGAAELLQKYHTLDGIYENIADIKQKGKVQKLLDGRESALLSKRLVALRDDVEIKHIIEDLNYSGYDYDTLLSFLKQYGFKSIEKLLSKSNAASKADTADTADIADTADTLIKDDISLLNLSICGLIFIHIESEDQIYIGTKDSFCVMTSADPLYKLFDDKGSRFIFTDAKSAFSLLDVVPYAYDDLCALSYSLSCGMEFSIRHLIRHYLHMDISEDDIVITYLSALYDVMLKELITQGQYTLYSNIEKPIAEILYYIEKRGIYIDLDVLSGIDSRLRQELAQLEEGIFSVCNKKFNLNSSKQLSEVLFEDMSLIPEGKKLPSGYYSTNNTMLTKLSQKGYDIADQILQHRHVSKLINTYTSVLPQHAIDSRIHTTFLNHSTNTGRLSSVSPNLQNIPTDYDIRSAFCAPDIDTVIVSADYSQIELRLLAHIADIKPLQEDLCSGVDLHANTASSIFNVALEDVTNDMRQSAKAVNFGVIYGISGYGLASRLGISNGDANKYIQKYFEKYPGIKAFMDQQIEFATQHGYVKTLFNRRCLIHGIHSKNHAERNFAQRAAINAPLQGSAADIIKKAMVQLPPGIKQVLQIHDELLFEIPRTELNHSIDIIKQHMTHITKLKVPLVVDTKIGWIK